MLINSQLQGRTQVAWIAIPFLVAEMCGHERMEVLVWRVANNKTCKNLTRSGWTTFQWRLWKRHNTFGYLVPYAHHNRRRYGLHPKKSE
jgi:hypothetical protein